MFSKYTIPLQSIDSIFTREIIYPSHPPEQNHNYVTATIRDVGLTEYNFILNARTYKRKSH